MTTFFICSGLVLAAIGLITGVTVWLLHRQYALAAPLGANELKWVPGCDYCCGGIQTLVWRNGRNVWAAIPLGDRIMVSQEDEHRGGPLANKRTCIECNGRNGHLVPKDRV